MVIKVTQEQYSFLQRIANGHKPGGVATRAVVEANKATRHKIADTVVAQARLAASKRALEAAVNDEARRARAKALRKTEKARKAIEKKIKNGEAAYRKATKMLAEKVAKVVNQVGDDLTAKKKRRKEIGELFAAAQPALEKYRAQAELQKRAIVRVTDVTSLYRPK